MYDTIKDLCKEKKLSIKDLEAAIGVGQHTIYRWDDKTPAFDKVVAVADYFKVSLDLIAGRPSPSMELTAAERKILNLFRDLNEDGQDAMLSNAIGLSSSARFIKKCDISASALDA